MHPPQQVPVAWGIKFYRRTAALMVVHTLEAPLGDWSYISRNMLPYPS